MRKRFLCQWPPGCRKQARQTLGDGQYCQAHYRLAQGEAEPGSDGSNAEPEPPRPAAQPAPRASRHGAALLGPDGLDGFPDQEVPTLQLEGMTLQCPHCGSYNFPAEAIGQPPRVTMCCHGGKASHLPYLPDAPEPLRSLLLGLDRQSRQFRACIRRYNSALSFVSFGACLETLAGTAGNAAPPVCIVHGAVYHHSYALQADSPDQAKHAQLYLFDSAEATNLRAERDHALQPAVLSDVVRMLESVGNPYIPAYRRMGELTQDVQPCSAAVLADSEKLHGA